MLTKLTKQNREFTRKSLGFPPEKLGKAKINMGTQPATSGMLAMLAVPRNWWEVSQTSMTSIGTTWRASRCQMGDYSQWWLNSGLFIKNNPYLINKIWERYRIGNLDPHKDAHYSQF